MILQELARHYEVLARKGNVPRQGWCNANVSYALQLDTEGELIGVISLMNPMKKGKKEVMVPQVLQVPEMITRTVGIASNFLCDNSKYLLGVSEEGITEASKLRFDAARKKHLELLQNLESEIAQAVVKFFLKWDPELAGENFELSEKWDSVTAGGNLVFRLGSQYAQNDEMIQNAWTTFLQSKTDDKGICLVTGRRDEISRLHSPIKGVQGAQSSGAMLVSFNAPAFESYGKEQSFNAPVGKYAMFAYTTALNYLLSQKDYVFTLGDAAIVFWAESGEEKYQKSFMDFFEAKPDNQMELKRFFENLKKGKALDVDNIQLDPEQRFFILGISPNAARLSVRFFYQNTFGKILSNMHKYYREMEVARPVWDTREYLGIWSVLMETANQKSKDKKPQADMTSALFQSVLSDDKYPEKLFSNTLIRIRAEQGKDKITRGRAAIVKAYLCRNRSKEWIKEGIFVALNEECNDVAYILGREFAVLEEIQENANPGINTTIKDRYFNSACSTPEMVFPVLMKLKENHIKKLCNSVNKDQHQRKSKAYYENILTKLQGKIQAVEGQGAYPKRLTLEEQGMFILGYYHQVQKRFEKREEM